MPTLAKVQLVTPSPQPSARSVMASEIVEFGNRWTRENNVVRATIEERGNGFPDVGDYVPGDDGELYRVVSTDGRIQTGPAGASNWIRASVEAVEWDDCDEEAEFPAMAVLEVAS